MNALEKINMAILLATISYVIAIDTVLAGFSDLPTQMRWFITFLTEAGRNLRSPRPLSGSTTVDGPHGTRGHFG